MSERGKRVIITVEELRRKYPHPVREPKNVGEYCVGMTLGMKMGIAARCITENLQRANPNLGLHEAFRISTEIVHENDAGNFDVAWAWLDKGLSA